MADLPTLTRACEYCAETEGVCNGEVVEIRTSEAREVFIRCAPLCLSGSAREQAEKFYGCLPNLLSSRGAEMSDVVLERIFFRDLAGDIDLFTEIQSEAYRKAGVPADLLPATSRIEQPPCRPAQAFEMQVYAIVGNEDAEVNVQTIPVAEPGTVVKIVEAGGHRHLYITNINGCDSDGVARAPFRQQSDTMFARSAELLKTFGSSFPHVLRTWCYLDEIDRDYDEFNTSRNEFFARENVQRLPASTGIRSGLHPHGTLCAMDLYALLDPDSADIEIMKTPTLNEAVEYGASFSRGMRVALPNKQILFISGTASVDEYGETVHVHDIRRQIERMLLNVRELMKPHGATFANVAQVITYLKWREHLDIFLEMWEKWGLKGTPNTFVEAGVCRPDLLCELEAIAIIPSDNGSARA